MSPEGAAWLLATGRVVRMRSSATGVTVKVLPEFVDIYLEAGWKVIEPETKGPVMTERDELIQIIWDGAVGDRMKDGGDRRNVPVVRPKVEALADAIIAAGWHK
ncbi:hypothetical protein SEA_RADFAD_44 [Arthrobacter phage RadFad]|nr:hypothetical protein SEA_RADFAD_44 [Arthrobacter phage RadFad]